MSRQVHVHPAAAIFPSLSDDEIKDLAADIKANGLRQPIMVLESDGKSLIIDGRSRMAACRKAKVEPIFAEFSGTEDDVVPYIISSNLARRHMTKGQRAMAAVMMLNNSTVRDTAKIVGVDKGYISLARQVLEADPNLARQVIDGEVALAKAHAPIAEANHVARQPTKPPTRNTDTGSTTTVTTPPMTDVRPSSTPKMSAGTKALIRDMETAIGITDRIRAMWLKAINEGRIPLDVSNRMMHQLDRVISETFDLIEEKMEPTSE